MKAKTLAVSLNFNFNLVYLDRGLGFYQDTTLSQTIHTNIQIIMVQFDKQQYHWVNLAENLFACFDFRKLCKFPRLKNPCDLICPV